MPSERQAQSANAHSGRFSERIARRSPRASPSSCRPSAIPRTRSCTVACETGWYLPSRFTWYASSRWNFSSPSKNSSVSVPGTSSRGDQGPDLDEVGDRTSAKGRATVADARYNSDRFGGRRQSGGPDAQHARSGPAHGRGVDERRLARRVPERGHGGVGGRERLAVEEDLVRHEPSLRARDAARRVERRDQ